MKEYKKVPNIITSKDLDYLSDMFNWLFGAYKNTLDAAKKINNNTLKKSLDNVLNVFYDGMDEILLILNGENNENSK